MIGGSVESIVEFSVRQVFNCAFTENRCPRGFKVCSLATFSDKPLAR
jgi:hypothetical protein